MERLIAFFSAGLIIFLSQTAEVGKARPSTYYSPPTVLKYFTFGYNDTLADLSWLNIVQNFDTCEMNLAPISERGNWSLPASERRANCKLGYVYRLLDLITELAPKFEQPYDHGGLTLSVLVDDREGAALFFRKAIAHKPDDWHLHYELGFHLMHEMSDNAGAAEAFENAAKLGAPKWVYALAARLYTKTGRAEISKAILEDMLKKTPEHFDGRERLENRLKEANEQLANETKLEAEAQIEAESKVNKQNQNLQKHR